MMRVYLLLRLLVLAVACSKSEPEQPLCAFDENGRIVMQSGNAEAACVEPAPVPTGAKQEKSGRLTILEAPLPAPFTDLDEKWPPDPVEAEPQLERPAMQAELSYYVRAFPQDRQPAGDVLDLASEHVIVLRDGCFFLDREGGGDPLVQFPFSVALEIDEQGYLGTFLHAAILRERAWSQQCWAIAAAGMVAVVLNAATTPHHIVPALSEGHWGVAIMDIVLIAGASLALWAALHLTQKAEPRSDLKAMPAE